MGTLTTNYGYQKPTPGADENTWGDDYSTGDASVDPSPGLNGNWEKLDVLFKTLEDRVTAAEQLITDNKIAAQIKVGDLYLSVDADDPATKLGYGTWEAHAAGLALVGVDTAVGAEWPIDEQRGASTHTLIEDEIPVHQHADGSLTTSATTNLDGYIGKVFADEYEHSGVMTRTVREGTGEASGNNAEKWRLKYNFNHNHNVTGDTANTGGGLEHNNVQPSIAIYVWKRVT